MTARALRGARAAHGAAPASVALLAVALLAAGLPPAPGLAAPASGTISGTVTNHTGTPRPLAGHAVRLTAYVNGAEQDWRETTSDARGRFAFTVPVDPQRTYVVWVHYRDGEYTSAPVVLKTPGERATAAVKVWEPTADPNVVRVSVHHIIVEPGEGVVQVAELLVLANSTDRTYVGTPAAGTPRRQALRFSLPAGAGDVQLMDGLYETASAVRDGALIDGLGVKPGMREVAYSYVMPSAGRRAVLHRRIDYPTGRLEVFARAGVELTVEGLSREDDVTTDQGTYARYSGGPLTPESGVRVVVAGLPGPRAPVRHAVLAVFAGILAAGAVYPLLRRGGPAREAQRPAATREELIGLVATLDDRYAAGTLPAREYRRMRARYLQRLRAWPD